MKICIKLDTDSLAIYRDLKAAVARIFEVEVYALHLHSIEDGCIQLIFILPEIVHIIAPKRDQLAQIYPSVLRVSLSRGSTREVIFEVFEIVTCIMLASFVYYSFRERIRIHLRAHHYHHLR